MTRVINSSTTVVASRDVVYPPERTPKIVLVLLVILLSPLVLVLLLQQVKVYHVAALVPIVRSHHRPSSSWEISSKRIVSTTKKQRTTIRSISTTTTSTTTSSCFRGSSSTSSTSSTSCQHYTDSLNHHVRWKWSSSSSLSTLPVRRRSQVSTRRSATAGTSQDEGEQQQQQQGQNQPTGEQKNSKNFLETWLNWPPATGGKSSTSSSSSSTSSIQNNITMTTTTTTTTGIIYDLAVIGGGVVGVQAALLAVQTPYNCQSVILIDAPRASGMLMNEINGMDLSLGGPTGLFSKALRDTSKRIKVHTLRGMGLREESVWNEIISNCIDLAASNANDITRQLERANIKYMTGLASFPNEEDNNNNNNNNNPINSLIVTQPDGTTKEIIRANKILIATGSQPFRPKGIPFDGKRIFDSDSINTLSFLPRSIAITGSGIIAVEFAKIFRNLGSEVTLIIRDQIPRNALMKIGLDKDVAATLVADLVRSGIKIERGAQVASFDIPSTTASDRTPIKIVLQTKDGGELPRGSRTEFKCDIYLAAVGRKPNTSQLNLAKAGIEVDEYGGIKVDARLCTSAKSGGIYAAGDVLGRPFLASTGVAQAQAAINSMFGAMNRMECDINDPLCVAGGISQAGAAFDPASLASNPFAFPTGVWSSPEAAYYGLSVQQAQEMGIEAGEGIALYAECLRGRVFSPNGLLKLVFVKPAGRILGVHICGDDACELIHYGMELVKGQRTIMDVVNSLYSAVTYHEMYKIAAQAALDEAGARKRRAAAGKALAERNRVIRAKEIEQYM